MERKACCHVTNAFLSRLELIWLKMSKKNAFLVKNSRRQLVKQSLILGFSFICTVICTEKLLTKLLGNGLNQEIVSCFNLTKQRSVIKNQRGSCRYVPDGVLALVQISKRRKEVLIS